jgi:hypothetical protein
MQDFPVRLVILFWAAIILASCATVAPVPERNLAAASGAAAVAPVSRFVGKPDGPTAAYGEIAGVVVPNVVVQPQVTYEEAPRASGEEIFLIEPIAPKRAPPPGGGIRGVGRYVGLPTNDAPVSQVVNTDQLDKSLSSVFLGNDTDNNASVTSGSLFIPPDNHVAVGPGHIVTVTNVAIQVHTKAATPTRVFNQSLRSFFTSLAVPAGNFTFDPKVLYDNASGRWVVMTMERTDNGTSAGTSRLLVAASQGSDPTTGTWRFTAINSNVLTGGFNHWADFPGFAVDEEAIYISANLFRYQFQGFAFGGARLWMIPKTPFYNGTAFSVSLIDPYAGLTPGATTTLAARLVGTPPGTIGTWFTSAGWVDGSGNDLVRALRIDNPLGAPTVNSQLINLGDIDTSGPLPLAPQLGDPSGPTLDSGDRRSHDALWRDDSLWMSFTTNPPSGPDAGQSTVRWVRIGTTNPAALTLLGQGAIGGESIAPGTHTYYGNVGVNARGRVVIGFSASAATTRPSAWYAVRLPGDAAGTTRTPILLRTGEGYYFRDFGGGDNRWGDYSGASVDEATGCVWVYNQYSLPPSATNNGGTGRWGTAGGRVCPGLATSITVDAPSASPSVVGQTVTIPFTLSETPPDAALNPGGVVTINASTGESCTATLPATSCTITFTAIGTRNLTASYPGDANFDSSTSTPRSQNVNIASTSLVLNAQSANPSVVGQSVAFPFALSVVAPGVGTPTGTVTITAEAGESCTATLPTTTCSITFASAGARSVTASYTGTSNFATSASSARAHTVNAASTSLVLNAQSANPSVVGQDVSFPFALSVVAPGVGTPTGTVTITAGAGESCTATLPTTTCSITFNSAGPRSVTASYTGTSNFATSTSSSRAHTVNVAATTTTITSNTPNPSAVGQAVTVSWSVGIAAPGAGTPTGTVTVTAGGGPETCQATLPATSCAITLLGVGPRTLTASYAGTSNFAASSGTASQTVSGGELVFANGFEPSP